MDTTHLDASGARSAELIRVFADELRDCCAAFADKACVYATGSFGRLEAGVLSDLDLFIVADCADGERSLLDGIDEIKLQSQLIALAERHDLPRFDGGGRFLASHTIASYVRWLGSREDDYRNTLTGRMLLLLESRPLLGQPVYDKVIDACLAKYFRDYRGNEIAFVPSFLINDILRMWRTFCVNYEFHRKEGDSRNKVKNLKLKFSRMMTCYSSIIYLLAVYARDNAVSPDDVRQMVYLTPTGRIRAVTSSGFWRGNDPPARVSAASSTALATYSSFLELTHLPVRTAVKRYRSDELGWRGKSYSFGRQLADMIDGLGDLSEEARHLQRLILI